MSTLKQHLRVAIRHLKLEQDELNLALDHAAFKGYDQPWIDAIDNALTLNLQALVQIQNILACIKHPAAASSPHQRRFTPAERP